MIDQSSTAFDFFPGQVAQGAGRGQAIIGEYHRVRGIFGQAKNQVKFALSWLCFDDVTDTVSNTVNPQPALFTSHAVTPTALRLPFLMQPAAAKLREVAGHEIANNSWLCMESGSRGMLRGRANFDWQFALHGSNF
jgi:hypothetical protein